MYSPRGHCQSPHDLHAKGSIFCVVSELNSRYHHSRIHWILDHRDRKQRQWPGGCSNVWGGSNQTGEAYQVKAKVGLFAKFPEEGHIVWAGPRSWDNISKYLSMNQLAYVAHGWEVTSNQTSTRCLVRYCFRQGCSSLAAYILLHCLFILV